MDQTAVLYGKSEKGARESLLTFIGPDLVAARWKQWRVYFKDMHLTGTGPQMLGGMYRKQREDVFPEGLQHRDGSARGSEHRRHPDLAVAGPAFKVVQEYEASVKKYPNPPSGNLTNFRGRLRAD